MPGDKAFDLRRYALEAQCQVVPALQRDVRRVVELEAVLPEPMPKRLAEKRLGHGQLP